MSLFNQSEEDLKEDYSAYVNTVTSKAEDETEGRLGRRELCICQPL